MRRIFYIEDKDREPQSFWMSVALLLWSTPRILLIVLRAEIFSETATREPLSVLDVMQASKWPTIRVTRDNCIIASETHFADGFEVAISRRGYTWTWRVGQLGTFITAPREFAAGDGSGSLKRRAA